ncbi:ribonuclease H2 subunit A [Hydra vulgaris]|uniref:ribonuclease H2 subunit A n=1 Tax=Hydra vulgaris TaxID=6087 RepID=UPI001F5F2ABF|nr:ribonuclease H2 subunit A isoform X1 [Hydra vulgaris]
MNVNEYSKQNRISYVLLSNVPEITKTEPCCLGIDEAGRGPVLGPMVYSVCYCPISMIKKLSDLGFADSKTLTEEKRDNLLSVIENNCDFIGWAIKIISPTEISNEMLRRYKVTLNEISHGAAIELTRKTINAGANITEMYVDTVGDASKYQNKLSEVFDGVSVKVTPKADALFPIVSAASICAKVARDRCIQGWQFPEGDIKEDYGSGYPADPKTKQWLKDVVDPVFGFPQFVRFSWSTCVNILEKHACEVMWEDDEAEETDKKIVPITTFFAQKKNATNISVKHSKFFSERKLEQVCEL